MKKTDKKLDLGIRPICTHRGCKKECQFIGSYRKDGSAIFRNLCSKHHNIKVAKKHGLQRITQVMAKNAGMTEAEYNNKDHPYRKHRKDYCENRDGRLGFKCRYKIRVSGQLQVDHISGNPSNNRRNNLQTLCANCHLFKTSLFGDSKTPGRKHYAI